MADKLSARTEITSGLTVNDLMHLVNAGASWKMKLSTLATWLGTGGGLTSLSTGAISGTTLSATGNITGSAILRSNYAGSGAVGGLYVQNTDDFSGTLFARFLKGSGADIGSIARVTTTDAVVYNTTSDGRLKTNVRDFTAADSGRIIDGLRPRWFDWKPSDLMEAVEGADKNPVPRAVTDPARIAKHVTDNQSHVGFIAQEEAAVDPMLAHIGAVTVGDYDPTTITKKWQRSDSALIPILVAELKSLRARVAALGA